MCRPTASWRFEKRHSITFHPPQAHPAFFMGFSKQSGGR
jgi:hypothetical protein